jgi:integrase/recombinase XerD
MPRGTKIMLSFADWPAEDQERWQQALKPADRFEESSLGAHLAPATRKARQESYGRFLGFISVSHPDRLTHPPEARIDRTTLAAYVGWRRTSSEVSALGHDLRALRDALKLIAPSNDWSWLLSVAKRMTAAAPAQRTKYHLITSDRLYLLGLELMDCAVAEVNTAGRITKAQAFRYRDGLLIAVLAMIPLRSGTLRALRIGQHLVKVGGLWALDIPAADTKSRRALDYPISREISGRIDLYLEQFRSRILGADKHAGLWASNKGRPMDSSGLYSAIWKRTKKAFGFGVNLHRFRHAAASFWSSQDPRNVKGVKDLLGHASFTTTQKHTLWLSRVWQVVFSLGRSMRCVNDDIAKRIGGHSKAAAPRGSVTRSTLLEIAPSSKAAACFP